MTLKTINRHSPLPPVATETVFKEHDPPLIETKIRFNSLQKNIVFVRSQQKLMLQQLKAELVQLKKENKELNAKLVSVGKELTSRTFPEHILEQDPELRNLIEESANLKNTLQRQKKENQCIVKQIEEQGEELKREKREALLRDHIECDELLQAPQVFELEGRVRVWLRPLTIELLGHPGGPRTPTGRECESIIKQIVRNYSKVHSEYDRLKDDLTDYAYRSNYKPNRFSLREDSVTSKRKPTPSSAFVRPFSTQRSLILPETKTPSAKRLPLLRGKSFTRDDLDSDLS